MGRPCTVCARLDRAALDVELANPACNVADFCRRHGLKRTSVNRHRDEHVGTMLRIYGAKADLPKLGELHGEYLRLYSAALDNLAAAQAGALLHIDDEGREVRAISHTGISRAVNEARKTLDSIVRLAADAAEPNERPRGLPDIELSGRIAKALERTIARGAIGVEADPPLSDIDAEVIEDMGAEGIASMPPGELAGGAACVPLPTPGGLVVGTGTHAPLEMSLDAAKAISSAPGLTRTAREVIQADAHTTATPSTRHEDQVIMRLPNPRYPGSPAATEEERRTAGYPDLEITLSDLRTNKDEVAELIAQHRPTSDEEVV
jgi:hypothetical protein